MLKIMLHFWLHFTMIMLIMCLQSAQHVDRLFDICSFWKPNSEIAIHFSTRLKFGHYSQ